MDSVDVHYVFLYWGYEYWFSIRGHKIYCKKKGEPFIMMFVLVFLALAFGFMVGKDFKTKAKLPIRIMGITIISPLFIH